MEDKYLVAKTLLECYSHIEDLYDALTERTLASVSSGFYAIFPCDQLRLYERIVDLENRKVGLYNMKFLIEECFRRGSSAPLSLLKEKYILKTTMLEMMKKYGVCLRTCYRYLKKGIAAFTAELEKLAYDKKKILIEFGNEPLFQNMLTKVIREDDSEEGGEEGERKKRINNPRNPLPLDRSGLGHCCV